MEKASSFLIGAEADTSLSSMIDASLQKVNGNFPNKNSEKCDIFRRQIDSSGHARDSAFFSSVDDEKMTVSYIYKKG